MVEQLAQGGATVSELAAPFKMSLPAISKHLRVLEHAGLLNREKRGRVHHIRLNTAPLQETLRWVESYRQFWESRFDELEHQLTKSRKKSEQ